MADPISIEDSDSRLKKLKSLAKTRTLNAGTSDLIPRKKGLYVYDFFLFDVH